MNRAEALPHYLKCLADFKEEFGHTNVPRTYEADPSLADWVRSVRNGWREGRLHAIHIEQLTGAGFCFAPLDEAWNTQYEQLKLYVAVNGNAKVPRDYEDRALAIWVMHQREHLKRGQLTAEQLELLQNVKFIFEPHEHQWAENMGRLKKFKAIHGHTLVPRRYPDDTPLADFVSETRQRFKAQSLSETQVTDLIKAEFVFDALETIWSQRLSDYAEWRSANPLTSLPPRRIAGKATPLYEWCRLQLANLKAAKIPADRYSRLSAAGFPVAFA